MPQPRLYIRRHRVPAMLATAERHLANLLAEQAAGGLSRGNVTHTGDYQRRKYLPQAIATARAKITRYRNELADLGLHGDQRGDARQDSGA